MSIAWSATAGGALGHPRVYLEMGAKGFVECGYCDRRFVLSHHAHPENEELDPADYEALAGIDWRREAWIGLVLGISAFGCVRG